MSSVDMVRVGDDMGRTDRELVRRSSSSCSDAGPGGGTTSGSVKLYLLDTGQSRVFGRKRSRTRR